MKRKPAKAEIQDFELSLENLKAIVSQLENGKLTLGESLQRYEEGIKFLKQCHAALNSAQMKIEQLVRLDENGRLQSKPFDDTASFDSSIGSASSSDREASARYRQAPDSVNPKGAEGSSKSKQPEPAFDSSDNSLDEDWNPDDGSEMDELEDADDDDVSPSQKKAPRSSEPQSRHGFLDFEEED